ncbi:MAG TPA: hypothetical protein EYG92_10095 [Lutibacter sp.]|nr:hypothetical protein [Lutibacter sp.]
MKFYILFFTILLFLSCSPKKEKIENKPSKQSQKELKEDSLNKSTVEETEYILHDGTYICERIDVEVPPENRGKGIMVTVTVTGNRIVIVYEGEDLSYIKKGDILEDGLLLKHKATGDWIIGRKEEDIFAELIGGCTDGPRIIDLLNGFYYFC